MPSNLRDTPRFGYDRLRRVEEAIYGNGYRERVLFGTSAVAQERGQALSILAAAERRTGLPTNAVTAAGVQVEDLTDTNAPAQEMEEGSSHHGRRHHDPMVIFGRDVELKPGQEAETVVVIGGSAKIRGKVSEAVVVIGGDVEIEGEVGEDVVVAADVAAVEVVVDAAVRAGVVAAETGTDRCEILN